MGALNEISKIKQRIAMVLLQDRDIVNVITDKTDVPLPAKSLQYTQVFPWPYVPDTTEKARTYVTYEVATEGINNPAVKRYYLTIYVFAHDNCLRFDDSVGKRLGIEDRGVRTDILADMIDKHLNGCPKYGFGKLEIVDERPFTAAPEFHGRMLKYRVLGWNRRCNQL